MAIIRPRHALELVVPLFGTTAEKQRQITDAGAIRIPVRCRRAMLTRNDHNHADTLQVDGEWQDSGVDPRQITSARALYWADDAGESGILTPSDENLRFVGIMSHPARSGGGGKSMSVSLDFVDYTSFFINQKPYPATGFPPLTATLDECWRIICDNVGYYDVAQRKIVSSVADLKDALEYQGGAQSARGVPIGKAVAARFRKLAKVQGKQGGDAWALWQQCVGMLGLISYFLLDKVVITTSTDFYTLDNPPTLVYGQNILEWTESAGTHRAHKGVGLTSFNPLTNTTIEAFYPPPGDDRLKAKRTPAKKPAAPASTIASGDYEWFQFPGVTDEQALGEIAHRAYDEYARQQIEGRVTTGETEVDRASGGSFFLLNLGAGDSIRIEFDSVDIAALQGQPDMGEDQRIDYLVGRGYSPPVATLMAKNFESFKGLAPVFHVKSFEATTEFNEDGGKFEVAVQYANLIQVLGGTNK